MLCLRHWRVSATHSRQQSDPGEATFIVPCSLPCFCSLPLRTRPCLSFLRLQSTIYNSLKLQCYLPLPGMKYYITEIFSSVNSHRIRLPAFWTLKPDLWIPQAIRQLSTLKAQVAVDSVGTNFLWLKYFKIVFYHCYSHWACLRWRVDYKFQK